MRDKQLIYSYSGFENQLDTAAIVSLKNIMMDIFYVPAVEVKNGNLKVSTFATIAQYSDFMRTGRKQYIINIDL